MLHVVAGLLALSLLVFAASTDDWRSRSIYQVMTDRFARTDGSINSTCNPGRGLYCGGSFQGLIDRLDYIQGMGFTAIWISPVTYQLQGNTANGEAYHGYWQQDLYQINPNFGTAADLKSLADALHARNMYLMVDVSVNHNAWGGDIASIDYAKFNPFNDQSHYHAYCAVDYSNITSVQNCWLGDSTVELVDLATEHAVVASGYQSWINSLVANYSVDGLRIDAAYEVNTEFWAGFQTAAGVFSIGEFDHVDAKVVCGGQKYMDSVLNYAIYFPLFEAFSSTSGDMNALASTINTTKSECIDPTVLGSFSENHDQPRFASATSDYSLARNIIAFTILADGIPIIYEGQEQHYMAAGGPGVPYNREAVWFSGYNTEATLYQFIKTLNAVRLYASRRALDFLAYNSRVIHVDASTLAIRKGRDGFQLITILSNGGASDINHTLSLGDTGWTHGQKVYDLLTCDAAIVGPNGTLQVPMSFGLPRLYYMDSAANKC